MSDFQRYNTQAQAGVAVDEGLRSYMLGVYNYMALGIAFTAIASFGMATWASANPAVMQALYASPLSLVLAFLPLVFILAYSFLVNRMSANAARIFFFVYASTMGVSMSSIFFRYNLGDIFQAFAITSAAYGALSLWGYTTKKDLSGWGTFLFMALVGLLIASLVNIFILKSGLGTFAISAVLLLVVSGLTAYDTQNIKNLYYELDNAETMQFKQINGAISLYINFIIMFKQILFLFMGNDD